MVKYYSDDQQLQNVCREKITINELNIYLQGSFCIFYTFLNTLVAVADSHKDSMDKVLSEYSV